MIMGRNGDEDGGLKVTILPMSGRWLRVVSTGMSY